MATIFTKPFSKVELESWLEAVEESIPPDRLLSDYFIENTVIPCDEDG